MSILITCPLQIFGLSLFLTAICTLLSPVVVKWNSIAFMVLRVFQVENFFMIGCVHLTS